MPLWLIPILPLAGCAINGLFGRRFPRRVVTAVGLLFPGLSMVYAWVVAAWYFSFPQHGSMVQTYGSYGLTWISAGSFRVEYGFLLDQLSLVMMLVVTGVGFVIHIYSVGYMAQEGGYYRYFSFLNLFMFFMLMLVLANSYLLMFVGWEGVGLASYLLIGFFFRRDSAASAGKKAFIVNRIGDFGFLIALFLMIKHFGSLNFDVVFGAVSQFGVEHGWGLLTAMGVLLMVGAAGKSAQLPLYVWLPDAMEGPTPVSALIHAATMVTAGVYMVARSNPIFYRSPIALTVVAIVGILTALFAATIGVTQHDIKRVLAYSTVSQLGYMFLACGVAAFGAGIFHLMTHAFFKALLFLAAGSVIHALGGEQDMRRMGGLRKKIPWTFWTMLLATLAIAGVPGFSGFFSKDEILWNAYANGHWLLWLLGVFTSGLTSFYMFRLIFLTFTGEFRGDAVGSEHAGQGHAQHGAAGRHIHESPKIMLVPLVVLAVLSVVGGYIGVPEVLGGANHFEHFLEPVFQAPPVTEQVAAHESRALEIVLMLGSVAASLIGLGLAWFLYSKRRDLPAKIATALGGFYRTVANKYYVDEIYGAVFVRPLILASTWLWRGIDAGVIDRSIDDLAGSARDLSDEVRRMQSGNIRSYAGWVALGAAIVIAYMVWQGAK